ncbi:uncharacterized protein B0I36DRAFT_316042 [Microdochium trichocladiopsis]|uniref:Ankyrin repeat-containing domain protein n=1 Tax=Microdochium trichocladiopsis TaxID=1682393 RepID=A0A9P9BV74_9PEZI|nr:uncharacterized protein B0I36DRAFT_316042 [Microdochium trichocladiopsis]KAH7038351.1 hypothetical protein B0I36DRAFT_316042 [Microdochium trichocladiopsis]
MASSTDVDQQGCTLLHRFAYIMQWSSREERQLAQLLMMELIHKHGVPIARENNFGQWPLHLSMLHRDDRVVNRLLVPVGDETANRNVEFDPYMLTSLIYTMGSALSVCNAFHVEPLSRAIIADQPDVVARLISTSPGLLDEEPTFGFRTHLHLAIGMGRFHCFERLVKSLEAVDNYGNLSPRRLDRLLMTSDETWGTTLAEYIVESCEGSNLTCHDLEPNGAVIPQSCWHATALLLIFAHKCSMRPRQMHLDPRGHVYYCRCTAVYFNELKHRRQLVRSIALQHLGPLEIRRFGLDQDLLLDRHYASVIKQLRSQDVHIPSYLIDAETDDQLLPLYHWSYETVGLKESFFRGGKHLGTVYALNTAVLAALSWSGFRDFQAPLPNGMTILDYHILNIKYPWWDPYRTWDTIDWILTHLADEAITLGSAWKPKHAPHLVSPSMCVACRHQNAVPQATVAHMLSGALALDIPTQCEPTEWYPQATWLNLLVKISQMTVNDGTICLCSPQGRMPFMYFLLDYITEYLDHETPSTLSKAMNGIIRICGAPWQAWHYQWAFRLLTFEAFWLEHTCDYAQDDIEEERLCSNVEDDSQPARNRDAAARAAFEDIASEFHARIARSGMSGSLDRTQDDADTHGTENPSIAQDVVDIQQDSVPAQNASDEDDFNIHASRIWESWLEEWVERVDHALAELSDSESQEDHVQASEADVLGVRWCEPPGRVDEEVDPSEPNYTSLEYWAWRFEEI